MISRRNPSGGAKANSEPKSKEKSMEVGQKVVFVRDVKGAEVGRHG